MKHEVILTHNKLIPLLIVTSKGRAFLPFMEYNLPRVDIWLRCSYILHQAWSGVRLGCFLSFPPKQCSLQGLCRLSSDPSALYLSCGPAYPPWKLLAEKKENVIFFYSYCEMFNPLDKKRNFEPSVNQDKISVEHIPRSYLFDQNIYQYFSSLWVLNIFQSVHHLSSIFRKITLILFPHSPNYNLQHQCIP